MATILVVEDELAIRKLAVFLLRDAGYQVVDFATADEAGAYLASPEHDIDALFTDVAMPGSSDGFDLARTFLAGRPTASVIITSGKYDFETQDADKRTSYIPKPWSVSDLLGAVGHTIRMD